MIGGLRGGDGIIILLLKLLVMLHGNKVSTGSTSQNPKILRLSKCSFVKQSIFKIILRQLY